MHPIDRRERVTFPRFITRLVFGCSLLCAAAARAFAQQPVQDTAAARRPPADISASANDPTAPLFQLQLQDWSSPSNYGASGAGNLVLARPVIPIEKIDGLPAQIIRSAFPLVTAPNGRTGLGDISALDIFFFLDRPGLRGGVGPTIVVPSATNRSLGEGKWQAGPAAAVVYVGVTHLTVGALVQNLISFAGEPERPGVNAMTLQPIIVYTVRGGWFFREDPILNFDWRHNGTATVPVNLGFGRVFLIGSRPINAYIQPEWNLRRPQLPGYVVPQFTLRFAFHLLYPQGF